MQLKIYDSVDEVLLNLAEYFVTLANKNSAKGQRFSFALSGGKSAKKLFTLLASETFKDKLEWDKIDFFFGDERYVPHTDDASNYKMACEVLLQPLGISSANIFPFNTSLPPVDAANAYWETIRNYFQGAQPRFNFILLGLGDNSHTASLFPNTPVLHETMPGVQPVWLEDQKMYRITLNAPLINLAQNIAFLVFGLDKAIAVQNVIEGAPEIQKYPAQLINPEAGELVWFLDKTAASKR